MISDAATAAMDLVKAAGAIAIVTGEPPRGSVDARKLATNEAVNLLERRGILGGREEQLSQGEGI